MLRNPKLRDAYENLKSLEVTHAYSQETKILLVNLRSTTLLLLIALDALGTRHTEEVTMLNATLQDNARLIQKALDHLQRQ